MMMRPAAGPSLPPGAETLYENDNMLMLPAHASMGRSAARPAQSPFRVSVCAARSL